MKKVEALSNEFMEKYAVLANMEPSNIPAMIKNIEYLHTYLVEVNKMVHDLSKDVAALKLKP